jgi:hypothetical protein
VGCSGFLLTNFTSSDHRNRGIKPNIDRLIAG